METLTANVTGKVRRETLNGRQYAVAPMTLIVPGVLPGSQGPLLYPPDEVAKVPGLWNHMPITNGHPTDNGQPVSARAPKVLERYQLGFVFNDEFRDGKRVAEAWVDVDLARQREPRILAALDAGRPVELSTGVYTDNEAVTNGEHEGKAYTHVARNYRGDHLAVLVDAVGACSLRDGCGLLVNKAGACETCKRTLITTADADEAIAALNAKKKAAGGSNCGIGSGGFEAGNTCAGGGGGKRPKSDARRFRETSRRQGDKEAKAEGFRSAADRKRFREASRRQDAKESAAGVGRKKKKKRKWTSADQQAWRDIMARNLAAFTGNAAAPAKTGGGGPCRKGQTVKATGCTPAGKGKKAGTSAGAKADAAGAAAKAVGTSASHQTAARAYDAAAGATKSKKKQHEYAGKADHHRAEAGRFADQASKPKGIRGRLKRAWESLAGNERADLLARFLTGNAKATDEKAKGKRKGKGKSGFKSDAQRRAFFGKMGGGYRAGTRKLTDTALGTMWQKPFAEVIRGVHPSMHDQARRGHRDKILEALASGKTVPADVLKDHRGVEDEFRRRQRKRGKKRAMARNTLARFLTGQMNGSTT